MINTLALQNLTSLQQKNRTEVFDARLARANLITKTDFDNEPISLNKKINSNKKSMYLLKIN